MFIKLRIYIIWLTIFTSTSLAEPIINTTPSNNVKILNHNINNNVKTPTLSIDQWNELLQRQQQQQQVVSPLMALPFSKRPSSNNFNKNINYNKNNIMLPLGEVYKQNLTTSISSQNKQNSELIYKNKNNNKNFEADKYKIIKSTYLQPLLFPIILSPVTTMEPKKSLPVQNLQATPSIASSIDNNRFRRNSEDLLAAVKPLEGNIKSACDISTCTPNYLRDESVHNMAPSPLKYESLSKMIPRTSDLVWARKTAAGSSNNGFSNKYGPLSEEYSGMHIWNSVNLSGKRERPLYVDEPKYVIVRRENEPPEQFGIDSEQIPFLPPRGRKDNQDSEYYNPGNTIRKDKLVDSYDLFMPNRGKKTIPLINIEQQKRTNFNDIFDEQDLFVPNRGKKLIKNNFNLLKRYTILDDLKGDLFIPNRGKKLALLNKNEMKNEKPSISSKKPNEIFQSNKKTTSINYKKLNKWSMFDDLDIGDLFYPNRGKRMISTNNWIDNFGSQNDKNNFNENYGKITDKDGRLENIHLSSTRRINKKPKILNQPIVTEETFDKQLIDDQINDQQLVNDYYYYY